MSDAIDWKVKSGNNPYVPVTEFAQRVYAAWNNAGPKLQNKIRYNFARYLSFLVNYIKKNKLSGQVLGKGEGAYDLIGGRAMFAMGNPRWKSNPGTLRDTFTARTEYQSKLIRGQFMETIYGRAWEYGFTRKAYTVSPKHLTRDGGMGWLVFFGRGKWRYSQKVEIPMESFLPRPHIQPSIVETAAQRTSMIIRPLANLLRENFAGVRQVGEKL